MRPSHPPRLELLFQVTHRFTVFESAVPRHQQPSSVQWSQNGNTWFTHAQSREEAKNQMRDFIIAHPEEFSFWGKTRNKYTREELQAYFEEALRNEPKLGEPLRLNQHRIEVEFIGKVIK